MGKLNKAKGNMYDWVTHVWNPITGCIHQCDYCYVKTYREQPMQPTLDSLMPKLGSNHTIFVGHLCDLGSSNIPAEWYDKIFNHLYKFPTNHYVLQSKNLDRLFDPIMNSGLSIIVGTTIETNDYDYLKTISHAPSPFTRAKALQQFKHNKRFLTIEPILDFDVYGLFGLIQRANPDWINIGADSKGHNLKEPSYSKVLELIKAIDGAGIEFRQKNNLKRLEIKKDAE